MAEEIGSAVEDSGMASLIAVTEDQFVEITDCNDPTALLSKIIECKCIKIPSLDTNKRGRIILESFFHLLL